MDRTNCLRHLCTAGARYARFTPALLAFGTLMAWAGPETPAQADAILSAMSEWARAGAANGISAAAPVLATLKPGDDVQAAVDAAALTGGVILLQDGDYPLTRTLQLRSGVILRGTDRVRTRLVLQLRAPRPVGAAIDQPDAWVTGVSLTGIERAGLEELTVIFDPTLPAPADPRRNKKAYADDPDGRRDLHVVSVAFTSARDCWLARSLILNSGSHPLVLSDCERITVDEVVIEGAHNRGPGSGLLNLIRNTRVRLTGLRVRDINTFVLHGGATGAPCRFNVVTDSRFEIDLRIHGTGTQDNLFENCAIAVPAWLLRPPLSPGNAEAREAPPGPRNLLYLCTVTRDYGPGARAFSTADDPNQIYEVLQRHARERQPSVSPYAPAPATGSLRAGPPATAGAPILRLRQPSA